MIFGVKTSKRRRFRAIGERLGKACVRVRDQKTCMGVWEAVLDIALIVWVLRAPVSALLVGVLVLGQAPQAYDLMFEVAYWSALTVQFVLLLVAWMAVTYYGCFLLLGTDRRLLEYMRQRSSPLLNRARIVTPVVLACTPPIIIAMSTIRSYRNILETESPLRGAIELSLTAFFFLITALFAVTAFCCVRRPPIFRRIFRRLESSAQSIDRLFSRIPRFGRSFQVDVVGSDLTSIKPQYLGPLLLLGTALASAGIFLLGPATVAEWFPRALIIPVLLGGWLPLLVWMSAYGRKLRMPLITGGLLFLTFMSAVVGDNHSVRRVVTAEATSMLKATNRDAPPQRYDAIKLNDAVKLWMQENNCAADPATCPRPIIIAAAGGASRAGFFTASVIGKLMDHAGQYTPSAIPALDASSVRKRIFAISGVSGGAVGAAMTVAAMAKAGVETNQPCTNQRLKLWYGSTVINWQDCLEALMSGDFLTPVVLGLTFNDRISFAWWPDRAAVLEESWEQRFATATGANPSFDWHRSCPGDLRCSFMSLRPTKGMWLPLLLLNGTSASSGQRIITSILDHSYIADDCHYFLEDRCILFLESRSFHDLLSATPSPSLWTRFSLWLRGFNVARAKFDVSISTAAHNSARFPLISPPGAVRNFRNHIIDHIVDGGYVDNYGALTASELAVAIHTIEPRLAPFLLAISNDPEETKQDIDGNFLPLEQQSRPLGDVTVQFEAFENARVNRGKINVIQAEFILDRLSDPVCESAAAHIRVWPSYQHDVVSPPVPMSWAVSIPVQLHLHQQTEFGRASNRNQDELRKIWTAVEKPDGCVGRHLVPSSEQARRRAKSY